MSKLLLIFFIPVVSFCFFIALGSSGATESVPDSSAANTLPVIFSSKELDSILDYFMIRHQGVMKKNQQALLMRDRVRAMMLKELPLEEEMTRLFQPVMKKHMMNIIKQQQVEIMRNKDIQLNTDIGQSMPN